MESLRVCKRCFRRKPVTDFHNSPSGIRYYCKKCDSAYSRRYIRTHREWKKQYDRRYTSENPRRRWAYACLAGHRRRGFTTELSSRELYQIASNTDTCFICGCKLNWALLSKGRIKTNSPSLDRLDNGMTIRKDNIAILCYRCNSTKRNRTLSEFVSYCQSVVERFHSHLEYPQLPHL